MQFWLNLFRQDEKVFCAVQFLKLIIFDKIFITLNSISNQTHCFLKSSNSRYGYRNFLEKTKHLLTLKISSKIIAVLKTYYLHEYLENFLPHN